MSKRISTGSLNKVLRRAATRTEPCGDVGISQIDNHRTGQMFGGYLHEPPPIVTAEELMEQMAAFEARSIFKCELSKIRNTLEDSHSVQEFIVPFPKNTLSPCIKPLPPSFYYKELVNYPPDTKLSEKPTPEFVSFEESSQIRHYESGSNIPAWLEAQKLTGPSMLDEDVLWPGFNDGIAMLPPGTQFFCMGDANHRDVRMQDWLYAEMPYLEALKDKGFNDIVLELNEAFEPIMRIYAQSKNRKAIYPQLKRALADKLTELNSSSLSDYNARRYLKCAARVHDAGLQFHCLDQQSHSNRPLSLLERIEHEKNLVERIKTRVGSRPTAIVYGSDHFMYDNMMTALLGVEKCHVTAIHRGIYSYRKFGMSSNIWRQPDRCFIMNDYTEAELSKCPALAKLNPATVKPFGRYGRSVPTTEDRFLQNVMGNAQRREIDRFEEISEPLLTSFDARLAQIFTVDLSKFAWKPDFKPLVLSGPSNSNVKPDNISYAMENYLA